jgi:hydrogenase nickel incorporation protein HypB
MERCWNGRRVYDMKIIEVRESIFADNDRSADALRQQLKKQGTFMINVMSSPGSGKTTLLTKLINTLKDKLSIALMDVDIETDLDASRIADTTGVPCVQIHNGGLCHIDAEMTSKSIMESKLTGMDLLILENIGNLVCPAEFDTGAHMNMMLLSIPEGDDKPLKYPLMFSVCDLIVITKIDTMPAFDFNIEKCKEYINALNPDAQIFVVSAKTGEGMDTLADWIYSKSKGNNNA